MQTSYSKDQPLGYEGQIADPGIRNVDTRIAESAIPFGVAVAKGAATSSAKTAASGTPVVGVSVRTHTIVNPADGTDPKYLTGDAVSVLTFGSIYVSPIEAVDDGDDVYFVHATGKFSKSAGSDGTAGTKIDNWKWRSKAGANGIAVLEVK